MAEKDLSNMVLRYYIGFENTEARFLQLTEFLKKTGIHRVLLFSAPFFEVSSIIPLEFYQKHAELIKPYMEKLRGMGVEVGINMINTIGHAYYADEKEFGFRRAITIDGQESRGCVCMREEKLISYIKEEYQYYAALKPSVIFTDDDIRAITLGQITCLCPEHVRLISRRAGKKLTRKEIRTHILGSTFDEDAVKEAYFSQVREDVEFLLLEIADAVHEVSPETEIGVMTTSYPSVTLDRNLNTFFDGLYDDKKVTRIRTGMDFYREGDHNNIPGMFSMPAIQREFIADTRVEIQPEIENDTYGLYYKSKSVTSMQILWCLTNGFRNMQLSLCDFIDCPAHSFNEMAQSIAQHMPLYNCVTELVPEGHRTCGINIYVNPKAMQGRRTKSNGFLFEANWHKWLSLIGIPLSTDIRNAQCVFLTGDDIVLAQEEEIDSILKRGAVIDLRAAEALVHRGYGERIGVQRIDALNTPFAGERFTDDEANGEYRGSHNSYYFMSSLIGNDLVGDVKYCAGTRILSNIIDHNGKKICSGVAIYENSMGERFCIMPMDNNDFSHFTSVNIKRKQQLVYVFEWISRRRLPVCAGNEKVCVNINCFKDRDVITLFNLSSDEIEAPRIRYCATDLAYLDPLGVLRPLNYRKDGEYLTFDHCIKALGVLILVGRKGK